VGGPVRAGDPLEHHLAQAAAHIERHISIMRLRSADRGGPSVGGAG
jgi:hypothetical protein